jgi:hypothetical protein
MALCSCCMSRRGESVMLKACALAGLAAVLPGCAGHTATWKEAVVWPGEDDPSVKAIVPFTEAGAALAAAGAIRELVSTNTEPRLFRGCSSPEQGLDVAVFTGPTPGLYYVVLDEHFNRCGGPRGRVLDWWYVYAVTPQGQVVARAPIPPGEPPAAPLPHPSPPLPEQVPPPAAAPATGADTPASAPQPSPSPAVSPSPSPAPPSPASPPPTPPG